MAKRIVANPKIVNNKPIPKPDPHFNGIPDRVEQRFGAFQFTGINLAKFNAYCFQNNLDRNDFEVQVNFLFRLLDSDPKLRGGELKKAQSIEEAAELIHKYILNDTSELNNTIDTAYNLLERNTL